MLSLDLDMQQHDLVMIENGTPKHPRNLRRRNSKRLWSFCWNRNTLD